MADNRTGLSAADIAESFRDRCGDGSMEWIYTPTQTWVLLDAADMLDENAKLVMKLNAEHLVRQNVERENAKLREQIHWLKKGDILHVLTDQEYIDQCERERLMQVSIDALDKENAKLLELVEDMLDGIEIRAAWHRPPTDEMCEDFAQRARELGVDA